MSGRGGRKRKKNCYGGPGMGKRSRGGHYLQPGLKGFLITCNMREKETVREAYNIFGEYAEKMYGPEQLSQEPDGSASEEEEEDIEAALKKEVKSIKDTKKVKRRFQVVESGAKNCVFIKTTIDSPDKLMLKLLWDISKSQNAKSRYMMRIHPVAGTCKAGESQVQKLVEDILAPYMNTTIVKSFCIIVKTRNNTLFGKSQVFPIMREVILDWNPLHTFDDRNPEFVFHMDIIKNVCCLSVMQDYYKLRKYNIQELTKVNECQSISQSVTQTTMAVAEAADSDPDSNEVPDLIVPATYKDEETQEGEQEDTPATLEQEDPPAMVEQEDTPATVEQEDPPAIVEQEDQDTPATDEQEDTPATVEQEDPPAIVEQEDQDTPATDEQEDTPAMVRHEEDDSNPSSETVKSNPDPNKGSPTKDSCT